MTDVDLQALRRGDDVAYRTLVTDCHPTLFRLALRYSPNRAVAEEAVQETWVAVLRGLDGFAGRASLRTWICRILVNTARRRAGLETRSLPFSTLSDGADLLAAAPELFLADGRRGDRWVPPEDTVLRRELHAVVAAAIATLPAPQRDVITLRDLDGWDAAEVSRALGLDEGHQRVLLHRARGRVRLAVRGYLSPAAPPTPPPAPPDPGAHS